MSSPTPEYFALFGLEPRFAVDPGLLTRSYREVLAQVHPDRHAGAGAAERRAAIQLSSQANEAYAVLRSDCLRAAYLCRSRGIAIEGTHAGALPVAFLEQQMQWREALESAQRRRDAVTIDLLAREVAGHRTQLVHRIGELLDGAGDAGAAGEAVRCLMFVEKLLAEIDLVIADHDDAIASGG